MPHQSSREITALAKRLARDPGSMMATEDEVRALARAYLNRWTWRSAITGRFVSKAYATGHPHTTIRQRVMASVRAVFGK